MIRRGPMPAGTIQAPAEFAAPWGARGYVTDLDGPVHWIEFGEGPGAGAGAPPVVFVHGLGGSHLNWTLVGPQLAADRHAVALDLRGFGLTPGDRRTATVQRNAALLDRFVREVVGAPAIVIGNSMGGLLAVLHAHAHPDAVAGLVLIDPALPPPRGRPDLRVVSQFLLYAMPGLGEIYLKRMQSRLPPRQLVQGVIELCFADPARADPEMLAASVALAADRTRMAGRDESFLAASRSLMRVVGQSHGYWGMMAGIRAPVLLIGGDADRLVPVASIRNAGSRNPGWDTVVLAGVGHTPQLETPQLVVDAVQAWLRRHFTPSAG
jgi:pimeloyl-ACP methyl ester carboxylesterase